MSVCLSVCVSMCGGQSIHSCKRKGGERKPEVLSDRFRCLYSINVTYIASCSTVHALNDYVTVFDRFIAQGHPS